MKKIFINKFAALFGIIFLAAAMRLVLLDKIPVAITGDELLYPITAKTAYITGKDLSGTWQPFEVFAFRYPKNEHQAELPYIIHLLFSAPFGFSLFSTKLPFAFMSIGIVILLYLIAKILFNSNAALCTGLAAAINPWLIVMGRTGYESTPATFFYLLGLYLVLYLRDWHLLWSVPAFILAFYAYIGTKLLFLPFVITAVGLSYFIHGKKYRAQYIAVVGILVLFLFSFIATIIFRPQNTRLSELFLPNDETLASRVDTLRKITIESPLLSILINKYTVYINILIEKTMRIF